MKRKAKADSPTVSFRLDGHPHAILAERARALDMSPGEYARELVSAALNDQHAKQMLDDLSELKHHLQRALLDLKELKSLFRTQREHLRNATYCLLVNLGDVKNGDAQEFVDKYMAD